ncbi:MAG: hypothetical protein Q7S04_00475 [Candidatus Moranbacteria bacterium]|nr:hypothetical protein [Candidatus Moranbacteria bacterium]
MATPAKAFELPSELPEDKKEPQTPAVPQEKKDSNVTYINREYDAYHTLEGCLALPEYEIVKKIIDEKAGASVSEIYMANAQVYAGVAEIKLSNDVLRLYAILRDHYHTPEIPDKLAVMGDPQLLTEVLRMKGESAALEQLKNSRVFKKG